MKRATALTPLSRDHHHGLAVAQRLVRATAQTATDARTRFLAFWREDRHLKFYGLRDNLLIPRRPPRLEMLPALTGQNPPPDSD